MLLSKVKFLNLLLLAISMCFAQVAFANSVGTVIFITGDVSVKRADSSVIQAEKNLSLNGGDTIETRQGRVQFSLVDGGRISLQPNSIFKINKYEFSGKEDGSEFAFMELIKGGLRTITGLIGHKNRDRYQLKTAVATIGIRGTEFTVNFNDNQFLMTTNHGSVDVCNGTGCLNAITGQSISVSGPNGAPKFSNKAAVAAAEAPASSSKPIFSVSDPINAGGIPNSIIESLNSNGPISNLKSGTLVAVFSDIGNGVANFVIEPNLQIGANGQLTDINYNPSASDKFELSPVAFSSYNTDGIVAWGQAISGTYNYTSGGNVLDVGDGIQKFDYIVGATPSPGVLANLTGTYQIFASTAPFLVTSSATTTAGSANSLNGGTLNFNFTNQTFGYNFQVLAASNTFLLSNSNASLSGINPNFTAGGTVTSLTNGNAICQTGCTGALGGNLVQGSFLGANGERIGLQYGFYVPGLAGSIYGGAVLK